MSDRLGCVSGNVLWASTGSVCTYNVDETVRLYCVEINISSTQKGNVGGAVGLLGYADYNNRLAVFSRQRARFFLLCTRVYTLLGERAQLRVDSDIVLRSVFRIDYNLIFTWRL